MKISLVLLTAAAFALLPAAPALAKGASEAKIDGPGLKKGGIVLKSGGGDPTSGTPLGNLTEFGGYFPATFGQVPDPMLAKQPAGALGARYLVTYMVPSPGGGTSTITQELYPYATPAPLTYTKPGQPFFGGQRTHGGWYVAPLELKTTLVRAGLPQTAPAGGDGDGWLPSWPATTGIVLAVAAMAVGALGLAARRRPRPARA